MKDAPKGRVGSGKPALAISPPGRQPATQRTLLSANFGPIVNPLQNGAKAANLLGRSVISAGDRLRDLIVPDALAAVVTGANWLPGMGGGGSGRAGGQETMLGDKKREGLRAELEDMLASSCPLCDSVVAGLDRPFVVEGEVDTSWTL
jgi:hypothetical protein